MVAAARTFKIGQIVTVEMSKQIRLPVARRSVHGIVTGTIKVATKLWLRMILLRSGLAMAG